ncbi:hypothetical protein JL720_1329 [Aureococcus anophagefferens]|nr:hypothetical protein JL720_1329 [Aureococcus anophagefferens]
MEIEATATNALDAALTELRRSPIEGPHPTSASDARAWADARGYAWGDDAAHLAAFLECEARAAKLAAAKRARAAPAGAVRKLRAAALELGAADADRAPTDAARRSPPPGRGRRPGLGADPAPATPEQRAKLEAVRDAMRTDYGLRRRMMLKRCDVTVQAFLWSDSARGNEDAIVSAVAAARDAIGGEPPPLAVDDALAMSRRRARDIAARLEQPISATSKVTVDAPMKSVIIGAVPDRGGHAHKQRPSARDMMPAWQQRTEGGGKGGKGRGGGRGRGGGGGKGRGGGRGKGKRK